jgi:hypothetical protein
VATSECAIAAGTGAHVLVDLKIKGWVEITLRVPLPDNAA